MTLYVNDMLLSGPQEAHEGFWKAPARHLEFDEPIPVDRILGRKHEVNRNEEGATIRCSLADFAKSSCEAYEAPSNRSSQKRQLHMFQTDHCWIPTGKQMGFG